MLVETMRRKLVVERANLRIIQHMKFAAPKGRRDVKESLVGYWMSGCGGVVCAARLIAC